MRRQVRRAAALCLLLTAPPGQAGPLNWAARAEGSEYSSRDAPDPSMALTAASSAAAGSSDNAPTIPPTSLTSLSSGGISLPTATTDAVEPTSEAESISAPLVLIPIDGKSLTSAGSSTVPPASPVEVPNTQTSTPLSLDPTTSSVGQNTGALAPGSSTDTPLAAGSPSASAGSAPLSTSSGYVAPLTLAAGSYTSLPLPSTGAPTTPVTDLNAGSGGLDGPLSSATSQPDKSSTASARPTALLPEISSATSTLAGQQPNGTGGSSEPAAIPTALRVSGIQSELPGLSSRPSPANVTVATHAPASPSAGNHGPSSSVTPLQANMPRPIGLAFNSSAGASRSMVAPSSGYRVQTGALTDIAPNHQSQSAAFVPSNYQTRAVVSSSETSPNTAVSGEDPAGASTVTLVSQPFPESTRPANPFTTSTPPSSAPSLSLSSIPSAPPLPPPSSSSPATPNSPTQFPPPSTTATIHPTGEPNPLVPTVNPSYPVGTSTVPADVYESNLSQAKNLNALYSTLTPQAACSGTQVACINGQIARCKGGAFHLEACGGGYKCLAFPMTNTLGASIGCRDPTEAQKVVGEGGGRGSSSSPASAMAPTTKRGRPLVTVTSVVTVVDNTPISVPEPSSYAPEPVPSAPRVAAAPRPDSPTEPLPEPVSSSLIVAPASDPPGQPTREPGRITVIESIQQPSSAHPGTSQVVQEPLSNHRAEPLAPNPTSLVLLPLDDLPTRATASSPSAAVTGGADGGDNGDGGAPRMTEVVNGTPTVSVYVTVTVTAKERETQTVTLIVPAT